MEIKNIVVGELEVNCYILYDRLLKEAIIVDPGADAAKIKAFLHKEMLNPKLIVNTHGHFDHIGANGNFNLPVYIHRLEKDFLTDSLKNLSVVLGNSKKFANAPNLIEEGDIIKVGDDFLKVLHTPGHTPGGVSLLSDDNKFVLTGDTLFSGGVGRTDLPYSSEKSLMESIKRKLFVLDNDTIVYPGHGPASTIGKEKSFNPFIEGLSL